MNIQPVDIVGILGAALLLVAYFMATTKRWQTHTPQYQLSNLAAAVLLVAYNVAKLAYVNIAINVVWASVAIVGLVFIAEHRRRHKKAK
jgi:lipid-A-disaccharide synthase-like uncharacterized protein